MFAQEDRTAVNATKHVPNKESYSNNLDHHIQTILLTNARNHFELGNYQEAFENYQTAAKADYAEAQYELGYFYQFGLVVDEDQEAAQNWYERAAESGYAYAILRLAKHFSDDEKPEYWWDRLNSNQTADGFYIKGYLADRPGSDLPNTPDEYYRLAEEKGHPRAGIERANYLDKSNNIDRLLKLAETGHVGARLVLADHYIISGDIEKGISYYQNLVDQGNDKALHDLALYHLEDGDKLAGKKLIESAASKGFEWAVDEMARIYLGQYFEFGDDDPLKTDLEKASVWALKAAETGNYYLLGELAQQYKHLGEMEAAEKYYSMAVNERSLGWKAFSFGDDFSRQGDFQLALKFYKLELEAGDIDAYGGLGDLYIGEQGKMQNYPEAEKWYLEGARRGDPGAMFALANLYTMEDFVKQDFVAAEKWLQLYGKFNFPSSSVCPGEKAPGAWLFKKIADNTTSEQYQQAKESVNPWINANPAARHTLAAKKIEDAKLHRLFERFLTLC